MIFNITQYPQDKHIGVYNQSFNLTLSGEGVETLQAGDIIHPHVNKRLEVEILYVGELGRCTCALFMPEETQYLDTVYCSPRVTWGKVGGN